MAAILTTNAALPQALFDPSAYPHPTGAIRLIETHISWVFLTGVRAYKIKKPVCMDFVNCTDLESRRHFCEEELRLNSRTAPEVYLGVVTVTKSDDGLEINGNGPIVDYAVCMRQFDDRRLLGNLPIDELTASMIDQLAETVADFHYHAAVATTVSGYGTQDSVVSQARDNFTSIMNSMAIGSATGNGVKAGLMEPLTREIRDWTDFEDARLTNVFQQRRATGRICECHGDLHLGNMFESGDRVVVFDGIEFNDDLRWIDVACDVAFVVMDLHHRKRPDLAYRFLNRWLEYSGDYHALHLIPFYMVYRAMVRAKVAALRADQSPADERSTHWDECRQYLELARKFTRRERPSITITMGVSGSGKTTATQRLIESDGSIRVRSDVERKRLFGLGPEDRPDEQQTERLYSGRSTRRTYEHLAELTKEIVDSGHKAIVDATFLRREERNRFVKLADRLGVPFLILTFDVDPATLKSRVRARNAKQNDASDATEDVVDCQLMDMESLCETEEEPRAVDAVQHILRMESAVDRARQ